MAADLGRCVCVCCRADFTADEAQGQDVSKKVNENKRERDKEREGGREVRRRTKEMSEISEGPQPGASNIREQRADQ